MKPTITLKKVWEDPDMIELRVAISNGTSGFTNQVYAGHSELEDAIAGFRAFKDRLHGGLLEVRFGDFGPDRAHGAFHARFQLLSPGRLYVTSRQESEFRGFANESVADTTTMHLISQRVQKSPGVDSAALKTPG